MNALEQVPAGLAEELGEQIRVFICDDDPDLRALLRIRLERDPEISVVGEAGDGAAALEGIVRTRPDVAVVDLVMPRLSGFEVMNRLRTVAPSTRTIMLSGSVTDRSSRVVHAAGGVACLQKASGLRSVVPAIHEAAGR